MLELCTISSESTTLCSIYGCGGQDLGECTHCIQHGSKNISLVEDLNRTILLC